MHLLPFENGGRWVGMDVSKRPRTPPGGPQQRPESALGGPRRVQEATGGARRSQEAKRPQEATGGPRRPKVTLQCQKICFSSRRNGRFLLEMTNVSRFSPYPKYGVLVII